MTVGYVIGTETEGMSISEDGIEYGPSGQTHVVDTDGDCFEHGRKLGYALCGRAVRVWEERPLDPDAEQNVHEECVALIGRS
jgi:hypothetical protein